ncbi:tripartite tricarboxylate transporter permease [Vibrio ziniensis]|uniref:Tripartite tricarboxylate transporter permease n=1 Tax=Vibrio ziniensis TaxID=2711221 RepID=A0A6G7CPN4_9VIBR|nr:tripartite tricarboxylate transporter permease [Vibrio ziniensis]QIH44050.1 tripartite tricarboxylate transporter permease [Vibrio ziniensis]
MEILSHLSINMFLLSSIGVLIGIIFGAIPGMTATLAVAVCLPLTYSLGLTDGLALLLGLYVGGISGGLVPAVLINIPGTPSSITTTFDGYPMAQRGQGESALKIAVASSLFGGLFSAIVLYFFAPFLANFAIKFSTVEKFLLIFLALTVISSLSKNMLMGIFSGLLGVLVALIGAYDISVGGNGEYRLMPQAFEDQLSFGFSLLPVLIGMFGLSSIIVACLNKKSDDDVTSDMIKLDAKQKFNWSVFKGQFFNLIRSSSIGTFVGLLPGIGGSAASVLAYTQQKNISKNPDQMGKGAPEGIITSESANNGLTGGALIPLLSLGIPGDSTTAVLIGAFTLQGIQVGPLFINENLETWDFMIISLFFANFVMFAIMFFAIRYVAKVVLIPKYILYPIIVMMCVIGAYAINYGVMFDVWTLVLFGIFGVLASKIGLEVVPFIIGFILGKSAEVYFVKSIESYGDLSIFVTKSPIAMFLWVIILASVGYTIRSAFKSSKNKKVSKTA